jgi:hypothetical protein
MENVDGLLNLIVTADSVLIGASSFILGFFIQLDIDKKLMTKTIRFYRSLIISLLAPAIILCVYGFLILLIYKMMSYLIVIACLIIPIFVIMLLTIRRWG